MKILAFLAICFAHIGCAIEPQPVMESSVTSDVVAVCDPFEDPDCTNDTGTGGGGTGGTGTGGTGGGGWTPPVNACTFPVACDPMLGYASDLNCITSCGSFSARCYMTYRCGYNCPESHIGYCGVF